MTYHREDRQDETRDFHSRLPKSSVPISEIDADNIHEESNQRTFDRLGDARRWCSRTHEERIIGQSPAF
jgi:hypothetical protein